MNKYALFLLFVVCLVGAILLPSVAMAVGVSPALVEIHDITPQNSVKSHVTFSRANPSEDSEARVSVTGNGTAAIHLSNDGIALLPKGQEQVIYEFVIEPIGFTVGVYEVRLKVVPIESDSDGKSGTKVLSGAESIVRFTVTNESVESFQINNVKMVDTMEDQAVALTYVMINDGNVDARPSKIEVTIKNEFDDSKTYSEIIPESQLAFTEAFTEETIDIETKINLSAGLYSPTIAFFRADEKMYSSENIRLQVTNADGKVPDDALGKGKGSLQTYLLAFGSLLALLFIVMGFVAVMQYRKKR